MSDPKTMLVMPGKKMSVSRLVKRVVQAVAGAALGAATIGVVMILNGLLSGRGSFWQWLNYWLAFVQRPEILVTMLLTAMTTVLFVYWQRDKERGR
mgnify:CR=1 FL=1|jgi:hypothetical protein